MTRIAIVGPESSGKTYLASKLAEHYEGRYVKEVAREHLADLGRHYIESDLVDIAVRQQGAEDLFARTHLAGSADTNSNTDELLVCDTDMITIRIWSQEKFNRVDPKIEHLVQTVHYDHWFLCKPDIPWEPDPLRENPHDRDRLFDVYERTLRDLGKPYSIIEGDHDHRLRTATALIDAILLLKH